MHEDDKYMGSSPLGLTQCCGCRLKDAQTLNDKADGLQDVILPHELKHGGMPLGKQLLVCMIGVLGAVDTVGKAITVMIIY